MIKRKKHKRLYLLHRAIIRKLSAWQIFWLCLVALIVLGVIGVCAPTALMGL